MDEDTSSSDSDGLSEDVASVNEFLQVSRNQCLSQIRDFQNCLWHGEIAHQRELIEDLKATVEFYKKMYLEKQKTCEDKELEIKTLKDTIKELKSDLKKTPNSTSNYGKERLKELEMDISKLEIENVDLSENKKLLEDELHQMKTENVQLREHVQKMKQESTGGSSELLKKLQDDMSRLKTQIEKLNNDKMALERKLHSYEADKDKLKEKAGKSSTSDDEDSHTEILERDISRLQKWNLLLLAGNASLQSSVTQLESLLEKNIDYKLLGSLCVEVVKTADETACHMPDDETESLKLENEKLKMLLEKEEKLNKKIKEKNIHTAVSQENLMLRNEVLKTFQRLQDETIRGNKAAFMRMMASVAVKDNEKLKAEVSSLRKFEAQIIQKNKEIKSINCKLQVTKSENESLVKENKSLREEINILKTTNAEETSLPAGTEKSIHLLLPQTVENLKKELEKLKMENLRLTKELKKQAQILEEEKGLAQDEKRELEDKISHLNEEMMSAFRHVSVESYKNEIRVLTAENQELRKANEDMGEFLPKQTKEIKRLNKQIQRMAEVRDNETSKFQNQIKSLTDEKAKLNKTIEKIKSKADVEKINQQLRNDNQKLSLRLEMAKEDKVELENNFKKLQEEKIKIDSKCELNMEEISQLQNQIKMLQDKIENSEDYAKLQSMTEKISKLESQLEILQKADENLKLVQTQNAEFEIKIHVYETENKTLEDKVNLLKTEGKKLLETLKSDKQKLKHEKIELQTEIDNLKLKVENLQGQLEREVHDISVQTSDEFMDEFESLREQVKVQETENENLNDQLKTYITVSQLKQDEVETLDKEFKSKEIETNSLKDDLEGMNLRTTIAQAQLDKVKSNLETWILTFNNQIEEANMYTFRQSLNWMAPILSGMNNVKEDVEKFSKFSEKIKRYKLRHYHDIIRELMEAELSCSICSDTMKNAVTLQCSHTFCEGCLELWKRTKWECPMCRARVEVQSKTPLIDNVIEKMMACFPKQNYEEIAEDVYNDDFPPLNIS